MKNIELKEYIDEKFDELDQSMLYPEHFARNVAQAVAQEMIIKFESLLNSIKNRMELFERNSAKFDDSIKELRGSVAMARALFKEQKNKTPYWYKISEVDIPPNTEVWLKDINGNEILAYCKGRMLLYPSDSLCKAPEFWRPI